MTRSKSSHRWLKEHFDDPYVKQAVKDGYRSRASYKLIEMQERERLFYPGQTVVDLGAAPGGWCQVVRQWVGDQGFLVASDVLAMDALMDVQFIQGDFTHPEMLDEMTNILSGRPVDIVISDMAPNISGIRSADQSQSMYLCELALDFCHKTLKPEGAFVVKVFQGEGFDAFFKDAKNHFEKVSLIKPKASRPRSREQYLVAKKYRSY